MKPTEEYSAAEIAEKMKGELTDYTRLKLDLFKAEFVEKIAVMFGKLIASLLLLFVVFFTILFASFFAGFYFSEVFHSTLKGFGLIALFYGVLVCVLLLVKRRFIQTPIANTIVSIIYNDQDED
jgi:hypothetical protein